MTTIQDNIASPFIQQLAQSIFGTQQQYIEDLLKIKKLMNKTKLGILSEQLFIILKQKYPKEYGCLLMEQKGQEEIAIEKEERKEVEERYNTPILDNSPENGAKTTVITQLDVFEKQQEQKVKELKNYQHWVDHFGRP